MKRAGEKSDNIQREMWSQEAIFRREKGEEPVKEDLEGYRREKEMPGETSQRWRSGQR